MQGHADLDKVKGRSTLVGRRTSQALRKQSYFPEKEFTNEMVDSPRKVKVHFDQGQTLFGID